MRFGFVFSFLFFFFFFPVSALNPALRRVDEFESSSTTALNQAIVARDKETVKTILDKSADVVKEVNQDDSLGFTPLVRDE